MKKIKEWWNTPISSVMNKPEHIKYTVIVISVITILSLILILLFVMSNSLHTTTDSGTYTEKPMETKQVQLTVNNQTSTILTMGDLLNTKTFGMFGDTPVLTLLFVLIPALVMGTVVRRRMRWPLFLFVQVFAFVMFGVSIWTMLIPVVFLIASFVSHEFMY